MSGVGKGVQNGVDETASAPRRGVVQWQPDPTARLEDRLAALVQHVGENDAAVPVVRRIFDDGVADRLAALQLKHEAQLRSYDPIGEYKYLDVVYWVYNKVKLAISMGLDRSPPLTILDIGAGGAHFARACQEFGHTVTSIDVEVPVYEDISILLGVRRTIMRVEPKVPLPNFDRKFDMVTAVAINFSFVDGAGWPMDNWLFFLNDLMRNQFRFPARLYLNLNQECRGDQLVYNPELLSFCARLGAATTSLGVIDWKLDEPCTVPGASGVVVAKEKSPLLPDPRKPLSSRLSALLDHLKEDDRRVRIVRKIFEATPDVSLTNLQKKYEAEFAEFDENPAGGLKFLDVVYWVYEKTRLMRPLDVVSRSPMNILDLGAGGAHWGRICMELGHRVVSIDIDDPLYEDIADLMGIRRTIMRIEPDVPLPNFDRKFDLVTAIAINFHQIEWNVTYWSLEQWKYLFNDLIVRHLRYPGRIYFELNQEFRDGQWVHNAEVLEYCRRHGATIQGRGTIDWKLEHPIRLD